MSAKWILPAGWPRPKGYSNGVLPGDGQLLVLAGQVGWDEKEQIAPGGLVPQFEQALKNVLKVIETAGGKPEHLMQLRIYLTDKQAYISQSAELGKVWRRLMGHHYPCMTGLVIAGLVEEGAMVELEGLAVLPREA
ncbi:MAG: RidA family protein [Deltaproteobacteria bacterium]